MANTVRIPITLPADMAAALRAEARDRDLTVSQVVRERIRKGPGSVPAEGER